MNKEEKKFNALNLLWLAPGPLFYLFYRLSFSNPQFIENVYSRNIFRAVNQALSTITGWFGFSLGEFLLYSFIIFLVVFLIVSFVKSIISKKGWWKTALRRLFILASVFSFLYASFIGLWAFNYARQPLGSSLELDTSPASVDELYSVCETLSIKAAGLREQVSTDEDGIYAFSKKDAMEQTRALYNEAAAKTGYDFLSGSFGQAKAVTYSEGLSQANITGVYFPFTAEANLNVNVPDLFFASAAIHEAAHQRGFAREDEANFLAYYVTSFYDDPGTEYSGTMLALVNSMNKLYSEDKDLYESLRATYSDGMNKDLEAYSDYWQDYQGKASEVSEKVNDSYLKTNMQQDGVKSYGRMVDLLIGLWRKGELQ